MRITAEASHKDRNLHLTNLSHTASSSSCFMCLQALFLLASSCIVSSRSIVESLPGYPGTLPFKLETGYVGVGEAEEVQLFYYFVESQRSPMRDPLLLWLIGGPACSGLSAFLFESGPLSVDVTVSDYTGGLPALHLNPFAWTQVLNIIYVDQLAGTGFSYANTSEGYLSGDLSSSAQIHEFLRKWLIDHPELLANQLYIGGDPYSGKTIPVIIQEIFNGIEAGLKPEMNLKGYVLGNPVTDSFLDSNAKIPFSHMITLISDEVYEAAKTSCNGNYVEVDASNTECVTALDTINMLIGKISLHHVLEPTCALASPSPSAMRGLTTRSLKENLRSRGVPSFWCRNYGYQLSTIWANNGSVQEALHVRKGTIEKWRRCNNSLADAYTRDVPSTISYHQNFSERSDLVALIYSGDHDLATPHVGTQQWIKTLNLTTSEYWQPWFVDGQVAGYTEEYTKNEYTLTYATVKGAGHSAPEYKPKECFEMIKRWFARFPL